MEAAASESASTGVFASASSTLSATHPYLHPKPRVGMTGTTKLHYDPTEHRFSVNDMQPQAVSGTLYTHSSLAADCTRQPFLLVV